MISGVDYIGVSAVTLCHDGKGNYLLGLRSKNCSDECGRWDLLGSGKVEHGETLESSMCREVKEEVGASIIKTEKLGMREVFRNIEGRLTHIIAFDYLVEIERREVVNAEPEKCDEIGWFRLDDFPKPMHSQLPYFLEKYRDKI